MAIEKGFPCNSSILEIEEGGVLIQEGCFGTPLLQNRSQYLIGWIMYMI